jgi:hypothetical protein
MPGAIYDAGANGLWVFLLVTVFLGGSAALVSGRAIANTWRPVWHIPFYMLLLAGAVRFFHYALFAEPFLSWKNWMVDFALLTLAALLAYRMTRARQMTRQYGWKQKGGS